ncbi:MAG: anion permease, partial [Planctomycetota bacterium]
MDPLTLVVLAVLAGILFDLTNGWNDSANAIATVVSTRVLTPWRALLLSASLNFLGALVSVKVAKTMGAGVVELGPRLDSVVTVLSAMLAAAGWVTWCTKLGLPISCSHSLVGGLVGATVFVAGWGSVKAAGLTKILVALLVSPVLGFILAYVLVVLGSWLAHDLEATPRQGRRVFGFFQLCSSSLMAFEHGKNDAQKVMGVISLALFAGGFLRDDQGRVLTSLDQLYIPLWVKIACALAMALGTAVGGWRVIHTLGTRLVKISTLEGFSAETAAGVVLETAASLGVPVSTTHTITGGIIGVGAAKG